MTLAWPAGLVQHRTAATAGRTPVTSSGCTNIGPSTEFLRELPIQSRGAQQSRYLIHESSLRAAWPKLAAEFVVIVVGVLVALGVDSWVSWAHDREFEREYLERLLQDVDYDLAEITFVEAVVEAAQIYADSLLMPGVRDGWDDAHLAGAVAVASNSRQVDLSRTTFQELVNSGRIGLLRSRELRTELASYDRQFLELVGFWDRAKPEFQIWVRSRIPNRVTRAFSEACRKPNAPFISDPTEVCLFQVHGWSAADLRSDLNTDEARQLLHFQTWRIEGTVTIAKVFRTAAEQLRSVILDELRAAGGAS